MIFFFNFAVCYRLRQAAMWIAQRLASSHTASNRHYRDGQTIGSTQKY